MRIADLVAHAGFFDDRGQAVESQPLGRMEMRRWRNQRMV